MHFFRVSDVSVDAFNLSVRIYVATPTPQTRDFLGSAFLLKGDLREPRRFPGRADVASWHSTVGLHSPEKQEDTPKSSTSSLILDDVGSETK